MHHNFYILYIFFYVNMKTNRKMRKNGNSNFAYIFVAIDIIGPIQFWMLLCCDLFYLIVWFKMTYCTDHIFLILQRIFIKFCRVLVHFWVKYRMHTKEYVYFVLIIWKIKVLKLAWCMIGMTTLSLDALFFHIYTCTC